MARSKTETFHEAVFFLQDHQVFRQMLKSEFEALLDGYVGLSDMADTEAEIVYLQIDKSLNVRALVFFHLYFDEDGRADPEWNIPIEELAKKGGSGPDLGGGPIRLACRSQCPINWHQKELWDPSMNPGANDFQAIRKAVVENRLGYAKVEEPEPEAVQTPSKFTNVKVDLDEDDIPLLDDISGSESDAGFDASETLTKMAGSSPAHRTKLARLIRSQRLRIKTLENLKNDELEGQAREYRLNAQQAKQALQEVEQSLEQFKVLNAQLKKRLYERNEQYLALQDRMTDQSMLVEDLRNKLKGTENVEQERQEASNLRAELLILKEQLERRNEDLAYRDEKEESILQELEDLQQKYEDLRNEGSIFEKLHELDVVFMAYHPGAGHVTIPFVDIKRYVSNTNAYVAMKCSVSEETYLKWLGHYENPVCQYQSEGGSPCGSPLSVVHAPSEFKENYSDLCAIHRKRF
ncbi:MAG: DNA repair protein [Pseudomonadales bacterium]|nr:DNA repair protein [Pseudomonadales bacterium]